MGTAFSSASRRVLGVGALLLVVAVTVIGVFAGTSRAASGYPSEHSPVASESLESSWPADGAVLWVPPREGHLNFSEPVRASTLTLAIENTEGRPVDELVRLTRGDDVSQVLFRMPLLTPGAYRLAWSVETVSGPRASGVVEFSLDEPFQAAGGQNHRHGNDAHLYQDSVGAFVLRLLFVLSAALALAAAFRVGNRGAGTVADAYLLRAGAGLGLFTATLFAVSDVVARVSANHDQPIAAFITSPGLTLFLAVSAITAAMLMSKPESRRVPVLAAGLVAVVAGIGHSGHSSTSLLLTGAFTLLLLSAAVLWASLATASAGPQTQEAARRMYRSAAVTVGTGIGMLYLHAGTADLVQAYSESLRMRLVASLVVAAALVVFARMLRKPARRPVLWALVLLQCAATSALLWMPPPAAGL